MARVTPGVDFISSTSDRNIITSSKQGDVYYYRNSIEHLDTDPRIKGSEYEDFHQALQIAPKIYQSKPNCWKDHFKRAYRDIEFGDSMTNPLTRRVTGYDLAMQQLINTIKKKNGHYYDPPCFCILPIDFVSEVPHTKTVFDYRSGWHVHYHYDEIKKPDHYEQCFYVGRDPFRSAAWPNRGVQKNLFLANAWSIPRVTKDAGIGWEWEDFKSPVMWPPIYIVDPGWPWDSGFGVWECCNFEWFDSGPCRCGPDGILFKCITGYYVDKNVKHTLCGRQNVIFKFMYTEKGMSLEIESTGGPPYKDVYLEDQYIGQFGVGLGDEKSVGVSWGFSDPHKNSFEPILLFEHDTPCPMGPSSCNQPNGKRISPSLDLYTMIDQCGIEESARVHRYDFSLGESIRHSINPQSPEFKIIVDGPFYDDRGFQVWYPWGGIRIQTAMNDGPFSDCHIGLKAITCLPGITEYCFSNEAKTSLFNKVRVEISNSTVFECCTKTTLSGLEMLDRTQLQ